MSVLGPKLPPELLYSLLPAFIRNRDFYQGQPLRALMLVLGEEYQRLWDDVAALYDDWFIETCAPERVAAIGDLIGMSGGGEGSPSAVDLRALTANAIAYRRRKGVPAVLERVLRDATGWAARVSVPGRRLVSCPALSAPRPAGGFVDLRNEAALALAGTAFDELPRLAAVRRPTAEAASVASRDLSGAPGLLPTDLAIWLWRLDAFPLERVTARMQAPGCFWLHPLGVNTTLFNAPRTPLHLTDPLTPVNLPAPLYPRPLAAWLARADIDLPFSIFLPGSGRAVLASEMVVADLSEWRRPTEAGVLVAVDPLLGRLAFAPGAAQMEAEVGFSYGAADDFGGGPYPLPSQPADGEMFQAEVVSAEVGAPPVLGGTLARPATRYGSLAEALAAWTRSGHRRGRIRLADSRRQGASGGTGALGLDVTGGRTLTITASNPGPGVIGQDLVALSESERPGRLVLENLWLAGRLETRGNVELEIAHCTVAPPGRAGEPAKPSPGLILSGEVSRGVLIRRSIVGPIYHRAGLTRLAISDSVVDGGPAATAITQPLATSPANGGSYPGSGGGAQAGGRLELSLERVTLLGAVSCTSMPLASAALFAGLLRVIDTADGLLSHCYVPIGSQTPTRVRCQPDQAIALAARDGGRDGGDADPATTAARVVPHFLSRRYGSPDYARLASRTAREIRTGAESGAEIGAFERLRQHQREAALRTALADYLPYGLNARVENAT